jgi:hypothetical protein
MAESAVDCTRPPIESHGPSGGKEPSSAWAAASAVSRAGRHASHSSPPHWKAARLPKYQ